MFAQTLGVQNSTRGTAIGIANFIGSFISNAANALVSNLNSTITTANTATWTTNTVKSFYSSDLSGLSIVLNAGTAQTGASDRATAAANSSFVRVGQGQDSASYLDGYLQRLTLWSDRKSDAFGKGITT